MTGRPRTCANRPQPRVTLQKDPRSSIFEILKRKWIWVALFYRMPLAAPMPQQVGVGRGSKVREHQTGPNCRDGEMYRKPNFNDLNRKRSEAGDGAPTHWILARRMLIIPPRLYVLSEGSPSIFIMLSIFRAAGSVYTETEKRPAVCSMPIQHRECCHSAGYHTDLILHAAHINACMLPN
jgi:hypothetical protein